MMQCCLTHRQEMANVRIYSKPGWTSPRFIVPGEGYGSKGFTRTKGAFKKKNKNSHSGASLVRQHAFHVVKVVERVLRAGGVIDCE